MDEKAKGKHLEPGPNGCVEARGQDSLAEIEAAKESVLDNG